MEYKILKKELDSYLKKNNFLCIKNPTRWKKKYSTHSIIIQFWKSYHFNNVVFLTFEIEYDFIKSEYEYSSSRVIFQQFNSKIKNYNIIFDVGNSTNIQNQIVLDRLNEINFLDLIKILAIFEEKYSKIINAISDIETDNLITNGNIMNVMGYEWKKRLFRNEYNWKKVRESRLHEYIDLNSIDQ